MYQFIEKASLLKLYICEQRNVMLTRYTIAYEYTAIALRVEGVPFLRNACFVYVVNTNPQK